jgi:hypothetical protein
MSSKISEIVFDRIRHFVSAALPVIASLMIRTPPFILALQRGLRVALFAFPADYLHTERCCSVFALL